LQKLIVSILIAVCGIAIFFRTSTSEFIWDDRAALSEIGTGSFSNEVSAHWKAQDDKIYQPVPQTVWSLASLFGKNTGEVASTGLHRLNLITHIATSILVFLILALVLENAGAGFIGGMLFLAHPLQTEAVSYVAAFNYVLAGFFSFLAIYLYVSQSGSKESWTNKPSNRKLYVATLSYLLAILSSPIAVVTPVFAYFLEKCLPKKSSFISSRSGGIVIPLWFVLAIPVIWLTIQSQETSALANEMPFWAKPVVALDSISFYLSKLFVPVLIGPDYGRSPSLVISKWWGFATWILPVLLLLAIGYWKGKAKEWYGTAFALFIIALLPTLGFIYFEDQAISTVANRYAYLAVFGLAFAAAYTVSSPGRAWLPVMVVGFMIVCGWQTWSNTVHWQNNTALWSHGLSVNPLSPIAHRNLGNAFKEAGDWQKAAFHFNKVLEVNTLNADIYYYLGEVEREHGAPEKAAEHLEKALKLRPNYADAHLSLGRVYLSQKNFDGALTHFLKAVELKPDNVLAQTNLGMLYVRKKAYPEAIPYLNKSIELSGKNPAENSDNLTHAHALLGLALYHTGDKDNAQTHLETALKGQKQNDDANLILAEIYFSQKKYPEARAQYEKVVKESGSDISVYTNLGIILAEAKEYDKAAGYLNKALTMNDKDADLYSLNGMIMFRLRKFTEATEMFEKALQLNAKLADPYYFMGDMARWQGKESESIAHYYKALKIDAGHADAHYRLGHYFMKKERFNEAVHHFQAALKTSPDDQRFQYNLRQAKQAAESGSGSATF
jgi:tetratricopeptide (TPR) repeat protein